jgi:hypothetical protein
VRAQSFSDDLVLNAACPDIAGELLHYVPEWLPLVAAGLVFQVLRRASRKRTAAEKLLSRYVPSPVVSALSAGAMLASRSRPPQR